MLLGLLLRVAPGEASGERSVARGEGLAGSAGEAQAVRYGGRAAGMPCLTRVCGPKNTLLEENLTGLRARPWANCPQSVAAYRVAGGGYDGLR